MATIVLSPNELASTAMAEYVSDKTSTGTGVALSSASVSKPEPANPFGIWIGSGVLSEELLSDPYHRPS